MFDRVYTYMLRRDSDKHHTDLLSPHVCVTCDNGGHAPADGVVEPHGTEVDVALLSLHAVDMEALHEHPGERGHEEVMQEDGNDRTQELEEEGERVINKGKKQKKDSATWIMLKTKKATEAGMREGRGSERKKKKTQSFKIRKYDSFMMVAEQTSW